MNYKDNPSYQDKEERRLITMSSMDNLLKFHEIERYEKHTTLKFYAVFLGGGLTLVFGMAKFSFGLKSALLEFIAISVIILINFLAIKKLLSVRGASNNIYHEYGRRLRFLLDSHSSDLDEVGKEELNKTFKKYIDEQKKGDLLPKHSSDTYEVYGFYFMNVIFSLAYTIPLIDIYKYFNLIELNSKVYLQLIDIQNNYKIIFSFSLIQIVLTIGVFFLGKYIIDKHINNAPNIKDN